RSCRRFRAKRREKQALPGLTCRDIQEMALEFVYFSTDSPSIGVKTEVRPTSANIILIHSPRKGA
ncbi:MAG: hypothetical protein PVF80_14305, partial [Gammaproteobacteria bacterium]